MASKLGRGRGDIKGGTDVQWALFSIVAVLGFLGVWHMHLLGADVDRAATYMAESLRTELSISPRKQIDHIYHQFMLTNDDDGHIVHMEDVSDKDLELAEARADAAETTLMHEQEGDDGGLEVAEDDVEEWGEEDVVMEGRDEAAVTVDADDEEGLQREADKEQGWLDIWGESDGEEKPVRRTGASRLSEREETRQNMTMHIGRSRRFAGHRQAQINSKGVGGAVKFARCGGMPSEWASSYRREPLPPLRYKKYQNSSGLTHLEGATGMHKQYFPTENGPQPWRVASNHARLQPHEKALQECLTDLGRCDDESQLAALGLRGMHEAFTSTYKAFQARYRSCALVGNSGGLLEHEYGPYIDNHDFIMRLNYMKVTTYEAFTGNRTHAQFLGHAVSRDLCCKAPIYRKWKPTEELHDIYTWHPANKEQIMRWLRKRIRSPDRIIQKNPMSDQFIESAVEVFRALRGELLRLGFGPFQDWDFMTTGMHALLGLLRHCDSIDVYGFTTSSKVSVARHQYHGTNVKPAKREQLSDPVHSWDNERMVLRLLHATRAVNLCST